MNQISNTRKILLYNLVLVILSALLLSWGWSAYRNELQEASLKENRFITTEWHLLQIIQKQAEEKLRQKTDELKLLQSKYEELKREKSELYLLHEIEKEIKFAEDERDIILDQMTLNLTIKEVEKLSNIDSFFSGSRRIVSISDKLNQDELKVLRKSQQSDQQEIMKLQRYNNLLEMENESLHIMLDSNMKEWQDSILANERGRSELDINISELRKFLEEKTRLSVTEEEIDITSLYKFELIQAILGLPEIEAEYPDLQDELQHYINRINSIERSGGLNDAYEQILQAFEQRFNTESQ